MNSKKIIDNITEWLKNYSLKSKTNGFVIGNSGGVDSAVTSTLCARTGLPVFCLDMPILQSSNEQNRATKHIDWLKNNFKNVSSKSIDLTQTFLSLKDSVEETSNEKNLLSLANSRSRLRMTTLYYFAGINNSLVAGTGNKVEDFGIGFYTKYGDGGVDISPIADLMKSEVQSLAKTLGVDMSIVTAAPTDGLWGDDRTDEDQLGASYPELEWAMNQRDLGKQVSDFEGRQKTVFEILEQLNKKNLHKMIPIPVCEIPNSLR